MDEPWVAVEGEDNWLIGREQGIIVDIVKAVRVLGGWLKAHKVDDIYDTDLEVGQMLAEDGDCSECFERGNVSGCGKDDIWSLPLSVEAQSQMPRPFVQCSMACSMVSHCGASCLPVIVRLI